MDFRTVLFPSPSFDKFSPTDSFFTIGSCFAGAIGKKLRQNKFPVLVNPFGTVYNPISIHRLLIFSLRKQLPAADSYTPRDDLFVNYDFHSEVSSRTRGDLEQNIYNRIEQAHQFLLKAQSIIITYGTAWVYQRNDTHQIVANCHKLPASLFTKRLLQVDEITHDFQQLWGSTASSKP
jgi:hypothetical protein